MMAKAAQAARRGGVDYDLENDEHDSGVDLNDAKRVCRRFCAEGLCVTVEPLTFVYTGGVEDGVRVGLINYPRFPTDAATLMATAERLGDVLRAELFQSSYSIVGPNDTIWKSWRGPE